MGARGIYSCAPRCNTTTIACTYLLGVSQCVPVYTLGLECLQPGEGKKLGVVCYTEINCPLCISCHSLWPLLIVPLHAVSRFVLQPLQDLSGTAAQLLCFYACALVDCNDSEQHCG